jgi:hypothetical protein
MEMVDFLLYGASLETSLAMRSKMSFAKEFRIAISLCLFLSSLTGAVISLGVEVFLAAVILKTGAFTVKMGFFSATMLAGLDAYEWTRRQRESEARVGRSLRRDDRRLASPDPPELECTCCTGREYDAARSFLGTCRADIRAR